MDNEEGKNKIETRLAEIKKRASEIKKSNIHKIGDFEHDSKSQLDKIDEIIHNLEQSIYEMSHSSNSAWDMLDAALDGASTELEDLFGEKNNEN